MVFGSSTSNNITILDGYTDEPACLGVPPFISPLPRYIYGAIKSVDKDIRINYLTIDEYRAENEGDNNKTREGVKKSKLEQLAKSKLLIIIAGAIVPGKYLRATPISPREAYEIASEFDGVRIIGGAAIRCGFCEPIKSKKRSGKSALNKKWSIDRFKSIFDFVCNKDMDAGIYEYLLNNKFEDRARTNKETKSWSKLGTQLVDQHPNFPKSLVIELEAGRGCVRYFIGGCSFCSEPQFGEPTFRPPEDISEEVKQFSKQGLKHFRLGALSCIFSYFAKGIGESETPTPNPKMVTKLLSGIRNAAPDLKVLHLDNANPAVMAAHISETKAILKTILQNCTGGNVLSFGLESADPKVIKANNLNTDPSEVKEMIELVNHYGAKRSNTGMPMLLPGLNFVYGLKKESKETFRLNFEFLQSVLDQNFLLRRINMRQVIPTDQAGKESFNTKKFHREFIRHKKMVREKIDRPMLKRMLPCGSILKDVQAEKHSGNITFGRQLGTYPLLVGIPYKLTVNSFHSIVITDYGFRSITGFASPIKINSASARTLQALPGIGAKRATRLIKSRPFQNYDEIRNTLDDDTILHELKEHISLDI